MRLCGWILGHLHPIHLILVSKTINLFHILLQAVAWNFVFWMNLLSGSNCIFVYLLFNFFSHQRGIVFQSGMDSFVGPEEQWGKYWLSPALLIFLTSIIKVLAFSQMSNLEQNLLYALLQWTLRNLSTLPVFLRVFTGVALRHCNPNGTWDFMHSLNKTWANYSDCLRFLQPDVSLGKVVVTLCLWIAKGKQNNDFYAIFDCQPFYGKTLLF